MKPNHLQNMIIGLFTVAAIILIILFTLFVEPSTGDDKQILNIRFSNISNIEVGTRVTYAGRPVGEVKKIQYIRDRREEKIGPDGKLYIYTVQINIDSKIKVYNTDEFVVQTSGLLGEKSIGIVPQLGTLGEKTHLINKNDIIFAQSEDALEQAFTQLEKLARKIESGIDMILGWGKENGASIKDTLQSFSCAMDEVSTAIHTINKLETLPKIDKTIAHIESISCQLETIFNTLGENNIDECVSTFMFNICQSSTYLTDILKHINSKSGTIGELIYDKDFYLNLNALVAKSNMVLFDLNHYGVFYANNKEWQRSRLKEITFMNQITSYKDLLEYMDREFNMIDSALNRLYLLMNETPSETSKDYFDSKCFDQNLEEIKRQIDNLNNNLNLFNIKKAKERNRCP